MKSYLELAKEMELIPRALYRIDEMPKYINHDYLPFTPMENRTMQALEAKWDEIKLIIASPMIKIPEDTKIFINKRKTMAILGLTVWDEYTGSWILEIATWLQLESSHSSNSHRRVIGVHTKEDHQGKKTVVIEIGAGTAIPTVRMKSENIAYKMNATLIRINPRESFGTKIQIEKGAVEGIKEILGIN